MAADPKEKNRRWYARNADGQRARVAEYKRANKQTVAESRLRWQRSDAGRRWLRETRLRLKYGITIERWGEILEEQGGRCAICRTDDPGVRGFFVDHDHERMTVRGLLCKKCNSAIGYLRDDAQLIRRAARYVETHGQFKRRP